MIVELKKIHKYAAINCLSFSNLLDLEKNLQTAVELMNKANYRVDRCKVLDAITDVRKLISDIKDIQKDFINAKENK